MFCIYNYAGVFLALSISFASLYTHLANHLLNLSLSLSLAFSPKWTLSLVLPTFSQAPLMRRPFQFLHAKTVAAPQATFGVSLHDMPDTPPHCIYDDCYALFIIIIIIHPQLCQH